jgi:hypothetical protein
MLLVLAGCRQITQVTGLGDKHDPIVGTWRQVHAVCSSAAVPEPKTCEVMRYSMIFRSDGSFNSAFEAAAADAAPERAAGLVPGTFRRGFDTLVLTSFPKKIRAAFIAAGGKPSAAPKADAETDDSVMQYRLDGDILETTWHSDDKFGFTRVEKYVRVK